MFRIFLFVLLMVSHGLPAMAESDGPPGRWSVSGYVGAGYLPMDDADEFFSNVAWSDFSIDRLALYGELGGAYHVTDKHAIALSIECITTTASLAGTVVAMNESGEQQGVMAVIWSELGYRTVPINLNYEFHPWGRTGQADVFFGAGVGYYLSEMTGTTEILYDETEFLNDQRVGRDGEGFGVHVCAAVAAKLNRSLSLVTRVRGRYADGMYFTDDPDAIDVDFHGVDVSLGVRWTP
jgi:hypothetical protein